MAGVPLEGSRLEIGLTIMHPQDLHEVKRVDQKTDSAATCCDAGQTVRTVVRLRAVFSRSVFTGLSVRHLVRPGDDTRGLVRTGLHAGVVSRMTSQVTTTRETLLNGKLIVVPVQTIVNVELLDSLIYGVEYRCAKR